MQSNSQYNPQIKFPVLKHVSQVRDAIEFYNKQCKYAFYEKTNSTGEFIYFSYKFFTPATFPDPNTAPNEKEAEYRRLLRECRGLVFDKKTGKPVSRCFHKFFNIDGPLEETKPERIDLKQPYVIVEKYDGTMCTAMLVNHLDTQVIRFRTKMGWETDVAKKIEEFVFGDESYINIPKLLKMVDEKKQEEVLFVGNDKDKNGEELKKKRPPKMNYLRFLYKWLDKGYTPIFEFVGPDNKIVISYEERKLVLLAIRNIVDGKYVSWKETKEEALKYGIPVPNDYHLGNDMDTVLKNISGMKNIEGFVLRFDDGTMFKAKTAWYREIHNATTSKMLLRKMREHEAWTIILNNELDDIICELKSDEMKERMKKFAVKLWDAVAARAKEIETKVLEAKKTIKARKDFVPFAKNNSSHKIEVNIMFKVFEGADCLDELVSAIKRSILAKIPEDLRLYLGGGKYKLELYESHYIDYKDTKNKKIDVHNKT